MYREMCLDEQTLHKDRISEEHLHTRAKMVSVMKRKIKEKVAETR